MPKLLSTQDKSGSNPVGARLYAIRKSKDLTRRDIVARTDIDRAHLIAIEKGECVPAADEIMVILTKGMQLSQAEAQNMLDRLPTAPEQPADPALVWLGNQLKRIRNSRQLSTVDVSLRANVSDPYISLIENAKRTPTPEALRRILLDGLKVSREEARRIIAQWIIPMESLDERYFAAISRATPQSDAELVADKFARLSKQKKAAFKSLLNLS